MGDNRDTRDRGCISFFAITGKGVTRRPEAITSPAEIDDLTVLRHTLKCLLDRFIPDLRQYTVELLGGLRPSALGKTPDNRLAGFGEVIPFRTAKERPEPVLEL